VIDLDRSVPALLVRTGNPVWDYGALATVRTLRRAGVDVHVQAHPSETELLRSRFLTGVVGAPVDPHAPTAVQIEHINAAVAAVGATCVAIAGDDESAVLMAEQSSALDTRLLVPANDPSLPRSLSDKVTLGRLAEQSGVPYPRFVVTQDPARLREFAHEVGIPLVLKSPAPFLRLSDETVSRTTVVRSLLDLRAWEDAAATGHELFAQEYLAGPELESWYAAGVRVPGDDAQPVWTGRKVIAHPTGTGIGVVNVSSPHPELARHVDRLCRQIGWVGPFDTDWIVDPRTGAAYLIDFNPRRGAQFRTFQTSTDVDVVRASHLLLTGRAVPWGDQEFGVVHLVENLAILHGPEAAPWRVAGRGRRVELSWFARDDGAPARSLAWQMAGRVRQKVRDRFRDGR